MTDARNPHAPVCHVARRPRRGRLASVAVLAALPVVVALSGCQAGPKTPQSGGLSCFEIVKTWNARLDDVIEIEAAAEAAKDYGRSNKYTKLYNKLIDQRADALDAAGC